MTTYKSYIGNKDIKFWDGIDRTYTRLTSTGGNLTLNKIGHMVDPLEIWGDGDSYTSATLNTAISAIGSNNVIMALQPGTWTISEAVTFPNNIALYMPNGAILSVDNGITLTIQSSLEAGSYQIFSGTGTVDIQREAAILSINPFWFGVKADGSTDDSAALQRAITTADGSGAVIRFPRGIGDVIVGSTVDLKYGVHLLGPFRRPTRFKPTNAVSLAINVASFDSTFPTVKDITIIMDDMPNGSVGISNTARIEGLLLERVRISGDNSGHALSEIQTQNKTGIKLIKGGSNFYWINLNEIYVELTEQAVDIDSFNNKVLALTMKGCWFNNNNNGLKAYVSSLTDLGSWFISENTGANGMDGYLDIRGGSASFHGTIFSSLSGQGVTSPIYKFTPYTTFTGTSNFTYSDGLWAYQDESGNIIDLTDNTEIQGMINSDDGTYIGNLQSSYENKNLILNPFFDVWSYGTSFSAPAQHLDLADGWKSYGAGTAGTISKETTTVFRRDHSVKLERTAVGDFGMYQRLYGTSNVPVERGLSNEDFAGKTVTAYVIVKGTTSVQFHMDLIGSSGTLKASQNTLGSSWTVFQVTYTFATTFADTYLDLILWIIPNNDPVYIDSVYLRYGTGRSEMLRPEISDYVKSVNELNVSPLRTKTVEISNSEIRALSGSPKELVSAQGANTLIEFVSLTLFLDYSVAALSEPSPPDDLAVEYDNGSGTQIITWDTTGFITAGAPTYEIINPTSNYGAIATATDVNKNLVLINTGGDYNGGASTSTIIAKVTYRVHNTGL